MEIEFEFLLADPPDELSVTGYKQGDVLKEGSIRRIKCTALSGNPLPKLEWFAGNKKVEGAKIEAAKSGTFVSSEISIKVDRSDNLKTYHCTARNKATTKPVIRSVELTVSFPPTSVEIEVEPESPRVGTKAVLQCRTDSSSPGVSISWYRNNNIIPGAEATRTEGEFGGVVTTSWISTKVTEEQINSVYRCQVNHQETSNSISNKTRIGVQCEYAFTKKYIYLKKDL